MNKTRRNILVLALVLLGGLALVAVLRPAMGGATLASEALLAAQGGSPPVVTYQGQVRVSGEGYTGAGYGKFAVVDGAGTTSYWSNDGSSTGGGEPVAAVHLSVSGGLFDVLLGDSSLSGMTQGLAPEVFDQPDRYLRVWFSTTAGGPFDHLTPDTRTAAVPYALQAQEAANAGTVAGYQASQLGADYQNVVIVAKSGGDYTSVQKAIDDINDARVGNPYLVWVAPGVYSETVTMKAHVHLQGAGQEATVLTSTVSNSGLPLAQATLILTNDTSLRDLTVGNSGTDLYTVALMAPAGTSPTLVADVAAVVQGDGRESYAIALAGDSTTARLERVTAQAQGGWDYSVGLLNSSGSTAILYGGSFVGLGGDHAYGIHNLFAGTKLEAEYIDAVAQGYSGRGCGLRNDGASASLHGGSFTSRGGIDAFGICNGMAGPLEAESITALGENGYDVSYGLNNSGGAEAILRGGSFTGRGGNQVRGIGNAHSGTELRAEYVTAQGEDGDRDSYGLANRWGARATLTGGSFTAAGGDTAAGIYNAAGDTTLVAQGVSALGEGGNDSNDPDNSFGLHNSDGAAALLRDGSFTGRGAVEAFGIYNGDANTTLVAERPTVLGKDGSLNNIGLHNDSAATATLQGGSYTGQGGVIAMGIENTADDTELQAERIVLSGKDGSGESYGLHNSGGSAAARVMGSLLEGATYSVLRIQGSVTVSNSRLAGGPAYHPASVVCVLVTRDTAVSSGTTCP